MEASLPPTLNALPLLLGAGKVVVSIRPLRNVRFLLKQLLDAQDSPSVGAALPIHRIAAVGPGSHRSVWNVEDPSLGHHWGNGSGEIENQTKPI